MYKPQFYRCPVCGQIVGVVDDAGAHMTCCGQPMTLLVPNTVDAAQEKHVPVVTREGDTLTVRVGALAHPMTEEHHIEWIYLHVGNGGQRRILPIEAAPQAVFNTTWGEPLAVYAYCNLHGLWMAEVGA